MTDPTPEPQPSSATPPSGRARIFAIAGAAVVAVALGTTAIVAVSSGASDDGQPRAAASSSAPSERSTGAASDPSGTAPSSTPSADESGAASESSTPSAGPTPKSTSESTSKPTSKPTAKPTGKPTSTSTPRPSPSPTPTSTPTFDPRLGDTVSATVSVDDKAALDTGITTEVTSIEDDKIEGDGVGQVTGPALRVKVRITNGTSKAVDLRNVTVNAYTGKDLVPAAPVNADDALDPFSGSLAAGATAKATYVFGVGEDASDSVTVTVDLGADSPLVVVSR